MIKENDLAGSASIEETLAAVEPEQWGFVEIEVRSVKEAAAAAEAWGHAQPMVMMLDNMSSAEHAAVKEGITGKNIILEISGGITLDNLAAVAGADVVSSSALNQSVTHVDFSMLFEGVG
jgi:nicotinate-nucleotide pyrophosphorylase (carboxylating)